MVHFQKAAAARFPPAFASLGSLYLYGRGVERDVWKAFACYYDGAFFEEVDCLEALGELAASGQLGEVAHDIALPFYKRAAACGSARAMRRLGYYYWKGEHVEQDLGRAAQLFHEAAELGDEFAAYNLGLMYDKGNAVIAPDLGKAADLYKIAAERGIVPAMQNLAVCYSRRSDQSAAAHWFHRAADHGSRLGMESLAHIYAAGEGVERDPLKAEHWRARAVEALDTFLER